MASRRPGPLGRRLLQATLGLTLDPFKREICLHNPYLPPFLTTHYCATCDHDASVDLMVHRDGDAVSVEVIRTEGTIRVLVMYDDAPGTAPQP